MNYYIDQNGVVHSTNFKQEETPAPRQQGEYPEAQASDLFNKYGIAS